MAKITEDQVEQAYKIAVRVYDKQLSAKDGVSFLHNTHSINSASASDYINDYKQMMFGLAFRRAMSAPAIDFFLCRIKEDKGHEAHMVAVKSVTLHIKYYEGLGKGRLLKMRKVIDKHNKNSYFDDLYDQVIISSKDSRASRLSRIAKAKKVPNKRSVILETYVRNPDIIAEALCEAEGVCGKCGLDAPFLRKRDNSPYLEVHHIVPLSKKGEDTLENVIALCPNCHREMHYG